MTKDNIQQFLDELTALEYYDEYFGYSCFKNIFNFEFDTDVVRCTTGAMMIAKKFDGKVFGYQIPHTEEYKNKLAYDCFGHDFAVVGSFLVDWWAKYVEHEDNITILDMNNPDDMKIINEKYLARELWSEVPMWKIKE